MSRHLLSALCAPLLLVACMAPPAAGDGGASDAAVSDSASPDLAAADTAAPDVVATDAAADASAGPDAAGIEDAGTGDTVATGDAAVGRCPSHADHLTLRVAKQTRRAGLLDEPVLAAQLDDPAAVTVELVEGLALLRAASPGTSHVTLDGAQSSASLQVDVDLDDLHFVSVVVEVSYGSGAGFWQASMPAVVIGPPAGRGPAAGSLDVVSLGLGGAITLELGVDAVDGPGVDLIVFENPFVGFYEAGEVAVSADGLDYVSFPCDPVAPFPGCAGVNPVHAHPDQLIDPTDPAVAGGDAFDLAQIGVARARYVRITDVGGLDTGGGMAGFDLDAVVAVHAVPRGVVDLAAPATLDLIVGERAAPRFDLVAPARTLFGVETHCSVAPAGIVELDCSCSLQALAPGEASLTAALGDLETTITVQVDP